MHHCPGKENFLFLIKLTIYFFYIYIVTNVRTYVLHILFDNYKCGRCFSCVKYLYTSFIILLFFGIIVFHGHSLHRYSAFFFFSANVDVTHYSSHYFNWGSACQRRRVLAVRKYILAC